MTEMTGACKYCGQIKIVNAESQEDADMKVTLDCKCPGGELERTKKHVKEQLDELIGELAPDNDWEPVPVKAFDAILEVAYCVAEDSIASCAMHIDGTNLKISRKGNKINIERSRTVRQGGSIEK